MRIPSQFNESSLYGRGKRPPPDSTQSYRRLLRLLVALVLVVMVMRQASRPQMYEVFFGDPGPVEDAQESRYSPIDSNRVITKVSRRLDAFMTGPSFPCR